jgi:hypothetical protein
MIQDELHFLIENQLPVFICREDFPPRLLFPRDLIVRKSSLLLLLSKDIPFAAPQELCFFFYRPTEFVTRGFYGAPLEETPSSIAVLQPHEILQIQRRRYPRLHTPDPSTARFSVAGGTQVEKGGLLDVSVGGALLVGTFSPQVTPNATITNVSLGLHMLNPRLTQIEVHIPLATVVRVIMTDALNTVALHFELNGSKRDDIENYIDLRIMETRYTSR